MLIDSLNKRILFLKEVIEHLHLNQIEVVHGRAEDLGHNTLYREKFDCCISRAVANLSTLSEYCLPFVKVGGKFISYKSGTIDDEVKQSQNAIRILSSEIIKIDKFSLPESDIERSIVIIEKINNLAKKYPRKAGVPTKQPL